MKINKFTFPLLRFINKLYFSYLGDMRALEPNLNGFRLKSIFHNKYGRGEKCMIKNCECK